MNQSPVLSPRPNPPGPGSRTIDSKPYPSHPKAKALAVLNSTSSPATGTSSIASSPGDNVDIAAQMNEDVKNKYVVGKRVGGGTYADVFLGHERSNPSALVAIKKIKLNPEYKDGMALDAVREIRFLSELDHPNVIALHAVFSSKGQKISLVLEYLPRGNLEELWRDFSISYDAADIKAWSLMTAQAVWFCHENRVLHRDIKSNNLLIAADGTIKLADFGLARAMADPGRPMSCQVITLYYRPPELIYGARHYGGKVDIWSVGCVIGELAMRSFLFPGDTEIALLTLHNELLGTPTEENWPGVTKLPNYIDTSSSNPSVPNSTTPAAGARKPQPPQFWRNRFSKLGDEGVDMLQKMLSLDPRGRLNARQVLQHPYWTSLPRPTRKEELPRKVESVKNVAEQLKRPAGQMGVGGEGGKKFEGVAKRLDFGGAAK